MGKKGRMILIIISILFPLGGCGTTKGILNGVEGLGSGVLQDVRGAIDGIQAADEGGQDDF